jgi:hypothetical protein
MMKDGPQIQKQIIGYVDAVEVSRIMPVVTCKIIGIPVRFKFHGAPRVGDKVLARIEYDKYTQSWRAIRWEALSLQRRSK